MKEINAFLFLLLNIPNKNDQYAIFVYIRIWFKTCIIQTGILQTLYIGYLSA